MLKIAICDDEKVIVEEVERIIEEFLIKYDNEIQKDLYVDSNKMLEDIIEGKEYDLIFLDIQMNNLNGMEVANSLRNNLNRYDTEIVFITSQESYMKEAFAYDVLRFITKPINKEEIFEALEYIIKNKVYQKKAFVHCSRGEKKLINYNEIVYIMAGRRKVEIYGKYENTVCNLQLCHMENEFKTQGFIKISRNILVNKFYIDRLCGDTLILTNGRELKVSRSMKSSIDHLF